MFYQRFIIVVLLTSLRILSGLSVLVEVEQGILRGQTVDFVENEFINVSTKIDVFRGVPFADPPVRFRAPVAKATWEGVYDATDFKPYCSQYVDPLVPTPFEQSEDCLYLNVYAPNSTDEKLPVMVFIHGGGFSTGSSMTYEYYGVPLVAVGNIVLVTINYRLGALGFLDTGDDASTGNYGLLDQAMALQWVRNNIEAFGGDNSMVTIFGESAGAGSVDFHVVSKYSRNLFDQAITQSGTSVSPWAHRDFYEELKIQHAFQLGNVLGCDTMDTYQLVECLTQVDAKTLEETVIVNNLRMGPTIDGDFLQESPRKLTERGDFKHCPMMIGFNRDEGTLFLLFQLPNVFYSDDPPYVNKTLFDTMVHSSLSLTSGPVVPTLIEDATKQEYVNWSQADNETFDYFETFNPIYGDDAFSCPSIKTARAHAMFTSEPVYIYFMTIVPSVSVYGGNGTGPGWIGAAHAEELQFVFGYPFIPELQISHGIMTDEEARLSVKFMQYWTNFARTGDPSRWDAASSPGVGEWAWPAYTLPELQYKELSADMSVGQGLKADECAFWNDFKPQLESFLASMDQTELEWREEFSGWQNDLEEWRVSFSDYQQDPYCDG